MCEDEPTRELRTRALLSVQQALVGEVRVEMRAIEVEISPVRILIRVFTHGQASEELREEFDAGAVTQVVAHFPYPDRGDPEVEFEFVRCDRPSPIPVRGTLVFAWTDELFESPPAEGRFSAAALHFGGEDEPTRD
jgi:hypothetical protein